MSEQGEVANSYDEITSGSGYQSDFIDSDCDVIDEDQIPSLECGALPTHERLNKIFTRMSMQLDFLTRTAAMMNNRMNILQNDIDHLNSVNQVQTYD